MVAGTTWLFASQAMRDNPVDVLIVDEAGQLGLADALAATMLGDERRCCSAIRCSCRRCPRRPTPDGAGASVLEHMLGERA